MCAPGILKDSRRPYRYPPSTLAKRLREKREKRTGSRGRRTGSEGQTNVPGRSVATRRRTFNSCRNVLRPQQYGRHYGGYDMCIPGAHKDPRKPYHHLPSSNNKPNTIVAYITILLLWIITSIMKMRTTHTKGMSQKEKETETHTQSHPKEPTAKKAIWPAMRISDKQPRIVDKWVKRLLKRSKVSQRSIRNRNTRNNAPTEKEIQPRR